MELMARADLMGRNEVAERMTIGLTQIVSPLALSRALSGQSNVRWS